MNSDDVHVDMSVWFFHEKWERGTFRSGPFVVNGIEVGWINTSRGIIQIPYYHIQPGNRSGPYEDDS